MLYAPRERCAQWRRVRIRLTAPYRSLAGALRRAGGYAKVDTPFAEFLWADFLRRRIKASLVTDRFETALVKALGLVRSRDADYLPGWAGPSEQTESPRSR